MTSQNIAVYGGTFDPVHNGHLEVARRLRNVFALDQVLFMPAYIAPHKQDASVSSAFHRYAMLALATENDDGLRISTAELDAHQRIFTVDTIAGLRARFEDTTRLFFIMGADSWAEIKTWRNWERLLQMCDHVVVTRPGYALDLTASENTIDLRGRDESEITELLKDSSKSKVFVTDAVMLDISATDLRDAARAGDYSRLRELTPEPVVNYIRKQNLYRNCDE